MFLPHDPSSTRCIGLALRGVSSHCRPKISLPFWNPNMFREIRVEFPGILLEYTTIENKIEQAAGYVPYPPPFIRYGGGSITSGQDTGESTLSWGNLDQLVKHL